FAGDDEVATGGYPCLQFCPFGICERGAGFGDDDDADIGGNGVVAGEIEVLYSESLADEGIPEGGARCHEIISPVSDVGGGSFAVSGQEGYGREFHDDAFQSGGDLAFTGITLH